MKSMINIASTSRYNAYTHYDARAAAATKSSFGQELTAAKETSKKQDAGSLCTGTYEQRLEKLRELHANTDYTGMKDMEKAHLIKERFLEAFGKDFGIAESGFYNALDALGENTIYAKIEAECSRQCSEADIHYYGDTGSDAKKMAVEFRASYGYENLSDDEIRMKVSERYSGGTLEQRYAAAWELLNFNIDRDAAGDIMWNIHDEMMKSTEAQYGYLHRDNPIRIKAMFANADKTSVSWGRLVKSSLNSIAHRTSKGSSGPEGDRKYAEMQQRLKEQLFEFLDRMDYIESLIKEKIFGTIL